MNKEVVVIYTKSSSPSFKKTRRFMYTVVGIHTYNSQGSRIQCENEILRKPIVSSTNQSRTTPISVVLRAKYDNPTSTEALMKMLYHPLPEILVVKESELKTEFNELLQYHYRQR